MYSHHRHSSKRIRGQCWLRPTTCRYRKRSAQGTLHCHQNGSFLQLTGAVDKDIPVPGTDFSLGQLQRAQALGDAQVLAAHGRPVLRLYLRDRPAGLVALVHTLQELG